MAEAANQFIRTVALKCFNFRVRIERMAALRGTAKAIR